MKPFSTVTISRCYVFVNWRSKEIDAIYPETVQGLVALVGDVAFEADMPENVIETFVHSRDFETINDLLAQNRCSFMIQPAWLVPPVDVRE